MSRDTECHASMPGNFRPARFVVMVVGDNPRFQVCEAHDGKVKVVAGRCDSRHNAHATMAGMNRADTMCQYCNGHTDTKVCADCGMDQVSS